MNRVLMILRDQRADATTDRHLLDRFLAARDEAAFAELVRRYGPVVWGACRRALTHTQDAEDAFQATFLVLLRRAESLHGNTPLGPWLYRVALMTARNVNRTNRRRAVVTGPMEHEVPAPTTGTAENKLDLDAALLALPERYREPVVLCHLQGLTRREAAERLGCPEGTLSARLNRAFERLRARLGNGIPVALVGAAVALPTGLATATIRAATVYSTSTLAATGVSPAVAGLTDGVLRMFWMKKIMTATVVAVLVVGTGILGLGLTGRSESVAQATEPLSRGGTNNAPEEPDTMKRLEKRLADLEKQKQLLDTTLEELKAEKQKLEDAKREKAEADAAAELGKDVAVVVGDAGKAAYTIREVINDRVAEITCSNLDALTKYLSRAFNDPKGPKKLRVIAYKEHSSDYLHPVFAACGAAGYTKATFSRIEHPTVKYNFSFDAYRHYGYTVPLGPTPGEIDLRTFAAPKK
ncbi:ECF RNA polymerase sigma factor SigW [Gemmata sp. SH-PL17]|uniref:RNA polymerase sigma factor n=1 Tax=Gemmata sp. SH-PL17 TaxID=1630693 RepID=UPI0004B5FA69|nr:sigma-70 family RNA polymerase sigma factor [Gemmata sp. SH-PL17]AMV29608.1 ECF RNA polymerase sigma factor SigW [Gemmata sp. SH-PL17]